MRFTAFCANQFVFSIFFVHFSNLVLFSPAKSIHKDPALSEALLSTFLSQVYEFGVIWSPAQTESADVSFHLVSTYYFVWLVMACTCVELWYINLDRDLIGTQINANLSWKPFKLERPTRRRPLKFDSYTEAVDKIFGFKLNLKKIVVLTSLVWSNLSRSPARYMKGLNLARLRKILIKLFSFVMDTHWVNSQETLPDRPASQPNWVQGPVSRKHRKCFGPVKPFIVHLYLTTDRCIRLKLLEWREPLFKFFF